MPAGLNHKICEELCLVKNPFMVLTILGQSATFTFNWGSDLKDVIFLWSTFLTIWELLII